MRDLIRQIIKEERVIKSMPEQLIDVVGFRQAIKSYGGYSSFNKKFPKYFSDSDNKIKLINALVKEYEEEYGDFIWFENIETDDIRYSESEDEEGNSLVTYLVSVDTDGVGYRTYKYDSDDVLDMDFEEGYFKLRYLEEEIINQIFNKLVNYFIIKDNDEDVSTPN